jgi:hypothetical protein
MERTRGFPRIAAGIGVGLIVTAVLWWSLAVPALVKYPTDVNATPRYAGTFTVFVDPATAAPLSTPQQLPLTIERHIQAIGDQSGSSTVLVDETIIQKAGTLVNTTQHNVYVMDRSSVQNVADPRAYAFEPSNVVDRSGAYRVNLPFDTNANGTYTIYKNEIGTTYQMSGDGTTKDEAGLTLQNYSASVTEAPMSAAYLAELNKSVPLPSSMTLDQLKPQLKALGVDVDALVAAIGPSLTPEDSATLLQIAGKPIPITYVLSFEGHAGVDTVTGAEVDVTDSEMIGAKPQMADLPTLQAMLTRYPNVPEAAAAAKALDTLSTAPATKLFGFTFAQTPASVADIAGQVKDNRSQVMLATRTIPLGLVVVGFIAFAIGGFVVWHRHPETPTLSPEAPELEQIPEPTKVTQ